MRNIYWNYQSKQCFELIAMSISLEITASVYFKGHLPKHFKVLIFDFPFSGFSLLLSVTECLPGRHAWPNLRVWMKKITQLRKKCYSFFFSQWVDPLGNVMEKVTNAGTVYKESKYYYWEPQSGNKLLCRTTILP